MRAKQESDSHSASLLLDFPFKRYTRSWPLCHKGIFAELVGDCALTYRPPRDRPQLDVIQKQPVTFWTVIGNALQILLILSALRVFMLMASFPVFTIPVVDQYMKIGIKETRRTISSWGMDRVFRDN